MGNNALRDADLMLGGNPLYLRDKAPTIHQEYVSDDEVYASYSISPEFSRLLSSPTFTHAVEEKVGAFTVVEIQVDPNREVQVRLPGEDHFEVVTVSDPRDNAEITRILKKSQEAYNRYRDSLPPTPVTTPSLSPGRVSPAIPSQVPDLSSQLADLRHELRSVKMQRELDNKRHQIQALKRQIRDLQNERADAHAILSEARELFEEEEAPDLVAAIKGLQREVREGRAENADLRSALEDLRRDKQAEVRELQDQLDEANGLFPSSDTRPLPAKIRSLMEEAERLRPLEKDVAELRAIILEMQSALPEVAPAELPQALKRLQEAHDALQAQLQSHKANALHLQGELAKLGQQHEVDEERVRDAVAIASDWQKRANQAEEELREFAGVIHDLRRELYDTREALKRDRHTLNLVERENVDLRKQAHEASENLEWIEWGLDIEDGASKPLADRIKVVGEALDAAQEKSRVLELGLEAQRLRFEQELQEAQEELAELRPLPAQVRQLAVTLEGVQRSLQSDSREDLPDQVARLKQQYDELVITNGETLEANSRLQHTLEQRVAELEEMTEQKGASNQRVEELTLALSHQKEAFEAQIHDLEGHLLRARNTNAKQLEILEAIRNGLEVEVELDQLPAEARSLVERYNALRSENSGNEAAIEELRSDLGELRSQLVVEARAKQKAESALEVAQKSNSALGSQLESQRLHFEQALQQAQEELEGLRPLEGKVKQLSEALEGVKRSLQSGSSEDLPGQVASLKQAYDQLVGTHGETLVANEGLQRSLDQQVREYEQLASQKRASDQRVLELTDELEASRSSNSALQDTLRAIQNGLEVEVELDQLPAEARSLVERYKKLSAAHSKDQETLQQLRREAGELTLSLEKETQAKGELQEALDQIKAQLERPDANIGEIAEHVAELQAAKGRAEKLAERLETEIEDVRRDASAAVERIRKLKASGEEESEQRYAALLKELEEVRRGATQLQSLLEHEGIESEFMRGTLRKAGEENIRMNLELLRLRGILASLEERLGPSPRLDVQMGQVPEFEHLPSQLQENLETARKKFAQAQAIVQRYEREISNLKDRHAQELAQIKGSVGKAREELDEAYQRDREALEAQVLEARTQFDDRREALRERIEGVREELRLMTESRNAYKEDNERLEHKVEKLEAIIARQTREALGTQSEVEDRDLIIEEERARAERIKSELTGLKSTMSRLAAERDDLEASLQDSSEMTAYYQEKSEKLRLRSIELSSTIDRLEEELEVAHARIKELETENDRLHAIIARLLGLEYPAPSTSYSAEDWASYIQRNYKDMTMDSLLERAVRTEGVLEEVHGKAREEEATRLELEAELQRRDEEERRRIEMLAQLEAAALAAQQNPINEIEQLVGADEHEVEVLEALNGLEAVVQGMGQAETHLVLSGLHQGVVNSNKDVLDGLDDANIEGITKKLVGTYASKPPVALLNIFNVEAVKIKQFAAKISAILNQQLAVADTNIADLVGKKRLQALTELRQVLSTANQEVLEFNRRVQEGEELERDELERVAELTQNIPVLRNEMSAIAQQFIPELLRACTASGEGRTYPFILRELHGWVGFFNSLSTDREGRITIPTSHRQTNPHKIERFRQAITPLNRTLEAFFRMIPRR